MSKKKIIYIILCCLIIISAAGLIFINKEEKEQSPKPISEPKAVKVVSKQDTTSIVQDKQKAKDLYSDKPYELPLDAIVNISKLPAEAKVAVDKVLETSQGFYFTKNNNDDESIKLLLINPVVEKNSYKRHNLQFADIDKNGTVSYSNIGYEGEDNEIDNAVEQLEDEWIFDEKFEPKRPLKHVALDEKGKTKFTEEWNYSDDEPIKYQMKDKKGNTISILKETVNDTNYLQEHIFYDEAGKTQATVTINYDGANISRFTYYNAKENSGISIISEFEDGTKVKENIYNKDYELIKTVRAKYKDGELKEIDICDKDGKEIDSISN